MKDTKIIHFQIPMDKNGELLISYKLMCKFMEIIENLLGENYKVCTTPFNAQSSENVDLENVNLDTLTLKEFLEKYNL